ncbi:toll/interleukin-1 receptor domain-containing protein [Aeromonas caviae]|uniref:toll/interleukin-1 receptor domain-containing protein n=1 Tax=Aeromonas caviae TaxID=648 RepID=UPI001BD54AB0|nr:toll/interleukin-1 receptor domain-containing protein [Aeromonas caviae]MBS4722695.1 toll/interleukin-1 receptor domain-containing protein [Aeromonas caviae]
MIKAFLSHSSNDKDSYVRNVANWLGKDNVVYDEYSFEEGEDTLEEILKGLDSAELFVLFISESALNSDWVQREISEAQLRLEESSIRKFYPIVIDSTIKYDDPRIPNWIRDRYNLRPIKRAQVSAKRIHNKLRELSWSIHPNLKRRQEIFVGRNDKQEEFEERIHDFDREKPTAIIASGISGVGRRTFLHRALLKTNITESAIKPSAIYLDRDVSIEEFIFKLNDLGLVEFGDDLLSLTNKSIEEKIGLIHQVMKEAYDAREIIYILDDGCLVNYQRALTSWFEQAINRYYGSDFPIFCIASRYKVFFRSRPRTNKYYFVELNELNSNERKRLLAQLLESYKVNIDIADFNSICELLFGLPEQISYAVHLLTSDNTTPISQKLPALQEYNSDKAASLLQKYESQDQILNFIRLLAQFEVISTDFVFSILSEEIYFPILEQLASEHICELIGIEGEIIRLNDVIRDYIKRNRIEVPEEFASLVRSQVKKLAESDDIFQRDSSEYIFALKESLKQGVVIDERLLIPAHYIRCMKDIYYSNGKLDKVVELADLILQKEKTLDGGVVQDIRYYLCLALAKKKDDRLLKEVQKVQGPEHSFLLGYYYRLNGRYDEALGKFLHIVDTPYVGLRAKREIVQVYVQTEDYDKAMDYAKNNYEDNRGNQFHIQAYFNCLINSDNPIKHSSTLELLIKDLRTIDSDQSKEMADIGEALIAAKVQDNEQRGLDLIWDAVRRYPDTHYPLLALCDIAVRYRNIQELHKGIRGLEELNKYKNISSRTLNRIRATELALTGDAKGAISLIGKDLSRYPEESSRRIVERLQHYATTL